MIFGCLLFGLSVDAVLLNARKHFTSCPKLMFLAVAIALTSVSVFSSFV